MFNLFKKSEYEEISQKIKYKNHKITEKLNKAELNRISKLSSKKQEEYLKEKMESIGAEDFFSQVFGYTFGFKDMPLFNYLLSINGNNYNLSISGKDEYFGFRCDYLLSENIFVLSLRSEKENNKEHEELKNILGKTSINLLNAYQKKPMKYETTEKAKKLHSMMIGTMYLNEFSYNERKKTPTKVI
jgi:hypothetical protein